MATTVTDVDHRPGPPAGHTEPLRPATRAGRLDAWPRDVWLDAMWENSDLGPNAREVARVYARYAGREDVSWSTWDEITRRTGIRSRDSISKAHQRLIADGWLVLVEKARQHRSARYRLTVGGQAIGSSPAASSPASPAIQQSGTRTAGRAQPSDRRSQQSEKRPPAVRKPAPRSPDSGPDLSEDLPDRDPQIGRPARAAPPARPPAPPSTAPASPAPPPAGDSTTRAVMAKAAAAIGRPTGPPPRCPMCSDQPQGSWGPDCSDCARLRREYHACATELARAIARARRACRDCSAYGLVLTPTGRETDVRCQHSAVPAWVWAGTDPPTPPARPSPPAAPKAAASPTHDRPPGWKPSPRPRETLGVR